MVYIYRRVDWNCVCVNDDICIAGKCRFLISFYPRTFELIEDTKLSAQKRWILISAPGDNGCRLLLAEATDEKQLASVGNQAGGRVAFFLHTDDFWRDFKNLSKNEIHFVRPPQEHDYGIVAVFEDLYGNLWDLIQPK